MKSAINLALCSILLMPIDESYRGSPIPIFVNPYDPALGGINCDSDCSRFANGIFITEEHYGQSAACHPTWVGCRLSFSNDFGEVGPLTCNDTGEELLYPRYVPKLGQKVQYVDILWDLTDDEGDMIPWSELPWWNHAVFNDYEVSCLERR